MSRYPSRSPKKKQQDEDDEIDLFDPTPIKSRLRSISNSPKRPAKRMKLDEDDQLLDDEFVSLSPRIKLRRECAEAAIKKIKQEGKPEEKDNKQEQNDSREGSCERSECPLQKTCCLNLTESCVLSLADPSGKLFHHLSKNEHVCHICYDVLWKPGTKMGQKFADWKTCWVEESRCNPSVKAFIMDQILPYWIACNSCQKYRRVNSEKVITAEEIENFKCENCDEAEVNAVSDAQEFSWILSIAVSPLLQDSPCLHYLQGGHYFYDEMGLSPVECKYQRLECRTTDFMYPFNIPDEQSKAFCLRPDVMEYDEVVHFPEYSNEAVLYLALRNLIVTLWNIDPFKYLTLKHCIPHLVCRGLGRVWYIKELERVLNYLALKNIINYGILDVPKEIVSSQKKPLDVIIIGAGVSGLAAARQLRNYGANVKVLEAKNHIGGRMKDDWSLGVAVGCGAQLVTGSINNPIILMCEQIGVNYRILTGSCPMIDGQLGNLVDPKVDRLVEEHFDCILDALFTWKSSSRVPDDASLQEQLELVHKTLLRNANIKWTDKEERTLQFHLGNIEFSCGAKMNDVSWRHWDQNEAVALFAGSHALLTDGSSEVLKKLANGTDVRTNHEVERVEWSNDKKKVAVYCSNGKRLVGDKVLIAVPLSVLKKDVIKFNPSLPKTKKLALNKIGAGLIEKVAVKFPRKFWASALKEDCNYFSLVPMKGTDRGLFNMFYDFSSRGSPSKQQKFVLMSYVCGDSVNIVNQMSDVEVVNQFVDTLQAMFPDEDIPNPEGHVVTHWGRDPHIGMSYSYVRVGGKGEHYDCLASSENKKLYFSGEHTNRFFPQTMTGAYLSGLREAGKMIEDINNPTLT